MTEYLVVALAFVALCACAIVGYTGLDAMERREEQSARLARHQRGLDPFVATPVRGRVATPDARVQFDTVTARVDWLEERVHGAEEQLDQLIRDRDHAPRA